MWAVSDSVLAQAYLYRIDVSETPAVITERLPVGGVDVDDTDGDFDLEGVAARPEGGFWLASEGRTNPGSSRPNLIVRTDADGTVLDAFPLPDVARRRGHAAAASRASPSPAPRPAATSGVGGDPAGVGRRPPASSSSAATTSPPARGRSPSTRSTHSTESPAAAVVGLSELTLLPDGTLAVIERDNQLGQDARIKRIYAVDPASIEFLPHGDDLEVLDKELLADVLDDLDDASISVPDKLEGLAVTADGHAYLVTDNDGVDENYGETSSSPRTGVH